MSSKPAGAREGGDAVAREGGDVVAREGGEAVASEGDDVVAGEGGDVVFGEEGDVVAVEGGDVFGEEEVIECAGVWWFESMGSTLPDGAFCGVAGGAAPFVQPRAVV